MVQSTMQPSRVFISYAHQDQPVADRLRQALTQRGIKVWNAEGIPPGDDFFQAVHEQISASDAVLAIITPASSKSDWLERELAIAISRQFNEGRPRIIPVVVDRSARLPFFLRDYQWADLSDATDFNTSIDRISLGSSVRRLRFEALR